MKVVKTVGKDMVPRAGVEPARPFGQRILSPLKDTHLSDVINMRLMRFSSISYGLEAFDNSLDLIVPE